MSVFLVDREACSGCGACAGLCAREAIRMDGPAAVIDAELCEGCGACFAACPRGAIYELLEEGAPVAPRAARPSPGSSAFPAAPPPSGAPALLRSLAAAAAPLVLRLADHALDRLLQRGRSGASPARPMGKGASGGSIAGGRRHRHRHRAP